MANVNSHWRKSLPAPSRTSIDEITASARALLEAEGVAAVTMQRVASAVGVRPPSLYKHVRDHGELMHRVANDVAEELADDLDAAASTGDPGHDLQSISTAFRAWAARSPAGYGLLTSPVPDSWRQDAELNARTSAAIRRATQDLVGPDEALDAARTFVAFVHGFVSLENAGAFRLGGDPETAYRFGVSTLIRAMAR